MTGTALRGFATINFWADDVAAARDWYADLLDVPAYFERNDAHGRLVLAAVLLPLVVIAPTTREFRVEDQRQTAKAG